MTKITRLLALGDFRKLALEQALRQLQTWVDTEEIKEAEGFVKRVPPPLLSIRSSEDLFIELEMACAAASHRFVGLRHQIDQLSGLAKQLHELDQGSLLLGVYRSMLTLFGFKQDQQVADGFDVVADEKHICFTIAPKVLSDPVIRDRLESDIQDASFLATVMQLMATARRQERALTQDEESAKLAAYVLLDRGVQLPTAYQGIGVYGFREHQTNLSLANPGEGHLRVTCSSMDLLRGCFVHVEHIDRDGEKDREVVEPYRLPATIHAARVRLHVGADAPCTAYIGRPVFETGVVPRDLLKSVHMTASACTAMFINGIADCKIGIERMTTSQAIRFMRAVAGNVVRDPTRQFLSAAININLPLIEDRDGVYVKVNDRFSIAKLGLELAVAGGFNKIAWDGSSNQEPSEPFTTQLEHEKLLDLVHSAHSQGLETYVSAGMKAEHMKDCTGVGVDGVGIGTSLHYYDPATGLRGQLREKFVLKALEVRDIAARTSLGRAAQLLARLDRLYFETVMKESLRPVREELYQALRLKDEAARVRAVEKVLKAPELKDSLLMQPPTATAKHPLMAQAERLLAVADEATIGATTDPDRWSDLIADVRPLVARGDITQLFEVLP